LKRLLFYVFFGGISARKAKTALLTSDTGGKLICAMEQYRQSNRNVCGTPNGTPSHKQQKGLPIKKAQIFVFFT
jgi:hypothetical protein